MLTIRYANPDTIPSRYPNAGWFKVDTIMQGDHWTLRGPDWALMTHVEQAKNDNNLGDYSFERVSA